MMVPRGSTVFAGIPRLPGPVRFHTILCADKHNMAILNENNNPNLSATASDEYLKNSQENLGSKC
jgi:hypothetical protein